MVHGGRSVRGLGAIVAGLVLAGACSGPDPATDPPSVVADQPVGAEADSGVGTDGAAGVDDAGLGPEVEPAPPRPDSLAGYRDRWARHRAETVERILANGWGVGDDQVFRGPGVTIDLSQCPPGWEDQPLGPDGVVRLDYLWPQSGNLGVYVPGPDLAMAAYLDALGPIGGHRIEVGLIDTAHLPLVAGEAAAEAIAADPPPLAVVTAGFQVQPAVADALAGACVPLLLPGPLAASRIDLAHHPWTVATDLAMATEIALATRWLADEGQSGGHRQVAAVVMDNTVGDVMVDSLRSAIATEAPQLDLVAIEYHDPASTGLAAEMERLAATGPDAVFVLSAGSGCLDALLGWAETGTSASGGGRATIVLGSFCHNVPAYLIPAGDGADGVVGVRGDVLDDPDFLRADPYGQFMVDTLRSANIDPSYTTAQTQFGFEGWLQGELLQIAAELPGGVTRTNHLLALLASRLQPPLLVDGAWWATSGASDPFPVEAAALARFDAAAERWEPIEPLLRAEGETVSLAPSPATEGVAGGDQPPVLTPEAAAIPACDAVVWRIPVDGARASDPAIAVEQESRAHWGLRSDEEWVRHVHTLTLPPGRVEKDGWFTDNEMALLMDNDGSARIDPERQIERVVAWGEANGDRVAGAWFYGIRADHTIVVALVDPDAVAEAELAALLSDRWQLEVHPVTNGLGALTNVAATLNEELRTRQRAGDVPFFHSATVVTEAGRVQVGVGTVTDTERAQLAQLVDPTTVCL